MYNEYMYYKNITKYGYQYKVLEHLQNCLPRAFDKSAYAGAIPKKKISLDYIITVQGLKLLKAI